MIQAMLAGVASIKAQQTRMNVIGNNLANVNTVAYKSTRVTFQDMMSQTLRGASRPGETRGGLNPVQYGLGVLVSGTDANMEQGSLQSTNRPTDLALQGNGFFPLSDGTNIVFSRDGAFDLDSNGDMVHRSTGLRLTGWTADPATGNIDTDATVGAASTLNIPLGLRTAVQETTKATWAGNLDSKSAVGATATADITMYDTLGQTHKVSVTFTKSAENAWGWTATSKDGSAAVVGTGSLTFDPNTGAVATGGTGTLSLDPNGSASSINVALDFTKISQLSDKTQIAAAGQNGFPPGSLGGFSISGDGVITGIYTNGLTRSLGQVAVAVFTNPNGLERIGGNLFRNTDNSGTPNIGASLTGGRGQINSGFLEQSNVDIGSEFTDLIITQRGFQANTRVVTTVDEMLQDLINMKR